VIGRTPASQRGDTRALDRHSLDYERIASGSHVQLSTPPATWEGVDRPFVRAAAPAADAGHAEIPSWVDAFAHAGMLAIRRCANREMVGDVLAVEADQALRGAPADRGLVRAFTRYGDPRRRAERSALADAVRHLHAERQGQDLRIAVVHWVEAVPAVARALGALGYDPGEPEWITVFGWLPGEAPSAPSPPGRFARFTERYLGAPRWPTGEG
jgi:hypothetical protein